MIGDNLVWDIQAPQALGLHAIWYDNHGKGIPPGAEISPDCIIGDISEAATLLEECK
jgi:putative hydrolase of the HAD superfamily